VRVAVLSDIHANLTALDAVIADLRTTRPDLVVHGGDLMSGGTRPADVIDRVREMNWPGVYGNTDEMLWRPHRVAEALQAPQLHRIRDLLLTHTIPATLNAIGNERLAWLRALPHRWSHEDLCIVHAGPDDVWQVTAPNASDEALDGVFRVLACNRVVYGHLHVPFVRRLPTFTLVNSGAVSQPLDGDARSAYVLLDDERIEIRRVEYDIEEEVRLLLRSDDPFAHSTVETSPHREICTSVRQSVRLAAPTDRPDTAAPAVVNVASLGTVHVAAVGTAQVVHALIGAGASNGRLAYDLLSVHVAISDGGRAFSGHLAIEVMKVSVALDLIFTPGRRPRPTLRIISSRVVFQPQGDQPIREGAAHACPVVLPCESTRSSDGGTSVVQRDLAAPGDRPLSAPSTAADWPPTICWWLVAASP
jgi:putative phosphoesterase